MVRPDVLVCLGEEWSEFTSALDAAGLGEPGPSHHHRTFSAQVRGGVLCIAGGLSSAVVETCLWELHRHGVERIMLVGTAGALPGYRGAYGAPHIMRPASSKHQNFNPPKGWAGTPTWDLPLPAKECISSDRFYGFSPAALSEEYPAEPKVKESWSKWKDHDAFVDMEVAAFYWFAQQFGFPKYAAVKAAANPLSDLDSLPEASHAVIHSVVAAAVDAFLSDAS